MFELMLLKRPPDLDDLIAAVSVQNILPRLIQKYSRRKMSNYEGQNGVAQFRDR